MSNNKGMHTKSYTQITSLHSSNTPSACGGDHLIFGEGFIAVNQNDGISPYRIQEAIQHVQDLDWRLQNFTLTV